jgi:asparagine synthase (glutamine-hydrolysing)
LRVGFPGAAHGAMSAAGSRAADIAGMCGILGLATTASGRIGMADDAVGRLRDLMTHRGPDGAGLWRAPDSRVVLAHRRLAVIDPTPAGAQPFVSGDGRHVLVYNGELYNDAALRAELAAGGVRFGTSCDTETVLAAFAAWGADALTRLRGMFALAWYDTAARTLLLARDPLGIKPLYFWISEHAERGSPLVVFASEVTPILAHPEVPVRPDLVGVSAYLTTIRTVMGNRTMFEGVRTLRPGEALAVDLSRDELGVELLRHWRGVPSGSFTGTDALGAAGGCVRDAVQLHSRADVPTCALLSGGLDSSAIVASMPSASPVGAWSNRTYCSGVHTGENSDFHYARVVAERFGTTHTEAPVTRGMFRERWGEMIARMGTPLSTPNEVAINEVARRLRGDGQVVALSGEGADELFAGYDMPMTEAAVFEAARKPGAGGGEHQFNANAWAPLNTKQLLFNEGVWRVVEHDAALRAFYAEEFAAMEEECGDRRGALDAHLRFHRRINLAGLLQRLDTATMLESVEGRTPFADRCVAELAESLPMGMKFELGTEGVAAGTKLALRRAFAVELPREVVERPKASFPLPFQEWVADRGEELRGSSFARELFAPAAIGMVAADAARNWRLAWPMINVAMWGKRWWG